MTDLKEHSFLKTYVRGEVLYGFWGVVGKGLTAVNAFLIISSLEVYRYGVYILILAFYTLVSSAALRILSSVIFNDIARFISVGRDTEAKKLFWETFYARVGIASFLSLALFLGADIIAVFYDDDIATFFRIISPVFLIEALQTEISMYLKARLQFTPLAVRPIFQRMVKFLLLVFFLVFFELGIREALYAYVISSAVGAFSFVFVFARAYKPWRYIRAVPHSVLLRVIKTHGKWSILRHLLAQATENIKPWLIKFFVNTEGVAVFSVASSILGGVKTLIPTTTLAALIPREVKDRRRAGQLLIRGTKHLFLLSLALGALSFIIVPPLIRLILPQYIPSILLFQILIAALPLLTFQLLGVTFLVALRRQKFLLFTDIVKIVANVIVPITFLYLFGLVGMALERIVLALIVGMVTYWYLLKYEVGSGSLRMLLTFDKKDREFVKNVIKSFYLYTRGFGKYFRGL